MNRGDVLKMIGSLSIASGVTLPYNVFARSFPSGVIDLVVPFAAGGHSSVLGRIFSEHYSKYIDNTVIVTNKGGGGGLIGADHVIRSAPNGQRLAFHASSSVLYSAVTRRPQPFDPIKDFDHIGVVAIAPYVIAVKGDSPFNDLNELVAYAKENPGELSYGSAGTGSSTHIAGERFKLATGTDLMHVPYKGAAPSIVDTISGVIDAVIDNFVTTLGPHQNGQLKILAVFSDERSDLAPDVPTAKELGIDFAGETFNIVSAPKGIPVEIMEILSDALQKTMRDDEVIQQYTKLGVQPVSDSTPEKAERFMQEQLDLVVPIIKDQNLYVS